jgi:CBS domain-containing protein
MQTDVPTVAPDDPIDAVIDKLRAHEVPGVAVVNEGGRCVGIITENDLVIGDEEGDLHLPHMISLFGEVVFLELEPLKRFEQRLRKAVAATAKDMMTADPVGVDADADVRDAAHAIARHKHNRLPVSEHGRYVGMVTRVDVLESLAGL